MLEEFLRDLGKDLDWKTIHIYVLIVQLGYFASLFLALFFYVAILRQCIELNSRAGLGIEFSFGWQVYFYHPQTPCLPSPIKNEDGRT